jgi:hypothetical protein
VLALVFALVFALVTRFFFVSFTFKLEFAVGEIDRAKPITISFNYYIICVGKKKSSCYLLLGGYSMFPPSLFGLVPWWVSVLKDYLLRDVEK